MKVIALKVHEYGGHVRSPGCIYEAEEKYVPLMQAMGNIRPADEESPDSPTRRRYKRRDVVAEES